MSSTDDVLHTNHNADSTNPNRIQKTSSPSISSAPNPRSCVTCRRRKVKCDKKHPCSNCIRQNIDCIFPGPGRAPRKPKKPIDSELIERLKKLEGVVQSLGVQVPPEDRISLLSQDVGGSRDDAVASQREDMPDLPIASAYFTAEPADDGVGTPAEPKSPTTMREHSPGEIEHKFGRLMLQKEKGRSRYINPSFWASLSTEVEDLKTLLDDTTDDEDDYPSPGSGNTPGAHQAFMFGYSSSSVDLTSLHPPGNHIPKYWELFQTNVDPLVKVVHVPTMTPRIMKASENLANIPRGLEAMLFSVYYAATTSLWPEECIEHFGEEKQTLLKRYRFGVEQALARANFLQTDEWIVLQAFVVYLICLRRNDDARVIWTLTGLVVRMAQSLGIHRDGTHYGLTPFQIEMRRRLWWQICILDTRASEDHGCDPTIIDQVYDTKMPLNVDDEDLDPDMKEPPPAKKGCTSITFGLIRFEISSVMRKLQHTPPGLGNCPNTTTNATTQQKLEWVRELHDRLEERYLKDSDHSIPLYWVIATVSRLIMSKMWLIIYHPQQRVDGGASLPQDIKDKLFMTSLENIEYSYLLETEARTRRWGWLFRTYVQWHAIAFLLSELRFRTKGEQVERAWAAIRRQVERRQEEEAAEGRRGELKGHLWRPMKKLMAVARQAYERERAKDRMVSQYSSPQFSTPLPDATANGSHLNRSHEMIANNTATGVGLSAIGAGTMPTEMQMYELAGQTNGLWADSPFRTPPTLSSADPNSTSGFNFGMPAQTTIQPSSGMGLGANPAAVNVNFSLNDWLGINPNEAMRQYQQQINNIPQVPQGVNSMAKFRYPLGRQGSPNANQRGASYASNSSPSSNMPPPLNSRESLSVDWEGWDNMVQEFGMDVDAEVAAGPSGNGDTTMSNVGMQGGMMAGQPDNSFMFNNNGSMGAGNGGFGVFGDTKMPAGQMGPWPYGSTFSGLTQWY